MNPMATKSPEERREIARKAHETRRKNKLAAKLMPIVYGDLLSQIKHLEARLSEMRKMEAASLASAAICGKALLNSEELVRASLPWGDSCGVYFLIDGGEVVYCGQSVNVYSRIASHAGPATGKRFDRYVYIPAPRELLDKLESLYIHCLRPKLNGELSSGLKCAPLTLEAVLRGVPHEPA